MIWSRVGSLKAGMLALRGAKLRNFWTVSGVIIGVASVISVLAIGDGIKQQIGGQIHRLGKDIITIRPATINGGNGSNDSNLIAGFSTSGPLTAKDYAIASNVKGLAAAAPLTLVGGLVHGDNGNYRDGFVIGTSSDLPSLLNQSMAYGVFWGTNDAASNVAVLGTRASEHMFNEDVPLGRSFTFHGQQFIVSGIFNQFNTTPLSQQADLNNAIFIPNAVAEAMTNNTAPTYEILARPTDTSQTAQVTAAIRQALDKAHGGSSNLSVADGNQNLSGSNSILDLITRLVAGVAAIALLVGELGIMNVMLASVSERTHEIGMRKAVGATNRQILGQFMAESSMLSLTGAVIGIGIAYLVDLILRLTTDVQPHISWQVVALASGVSLVVGILFGSVPALKAARKDPIQSLRSE